MENKLVRYENEKHKTCFLRRTIRGRGTCCWNVIDPITKEKYVAKDCWCSADRSPEWELLEKAKGLDGVGQMIDYWEPKGLSISRVRGIERGGLKFPRPGFLQGLAEEVRKTHPRI